MSIGAFYRIVGFLVVVSHFVSPRPALSTPLSGGDHVLGGTNVAARPELAGIVLEDVATPYDFTRLGRRLTGVVQNRVVQSTVDGTLDFYWRIRPDAASTGEITTFRVGGFGEFALDSDWRTDGLGHVAPDIARDFGNGSVNFLFSEVGVGPAEQDSSRFFFLDTEATHYNEFGQYDLLCADSGCMSPLYSTFAPAVPQLQAGDADQDLDFDQFDLIQVQLAGKYETGLPATWGEGDWNGAPGGAPGSPPAGNGRFDRFDIIAAQATGLFMAGHYAALTPGVPAGELGTIAVPEPLSLGLFVCGVVLTLGSLRRRT
jgi:hypothetical protein